MVFALLPKALNPSELAPLKVSLFKKLAKGELMPVGRPVESAIWEMM